MPRPAQTLIAINAVRADRVAEFEEFLRSVVVPAMWDQRPDLDGRWRVLRTGDADEGTVTFAFVCEGGSPDDWDLRPYLETALGAEGADRELERFADMLQGGQQTWFLGTVEFDRP